MKNPSGALQAAVYERLRTFPAVSALVAGRVYDRVPERRQFPYITIGDDQVLGAVGDCYDGSEVFVQVQVWTRGVGFPETKQVAGAVHDALDDAADALALDGHRVVDIRYRDTFFRRDDDGLTGRAIMTFRAFTEPVDP